MGKVIVGATMSLDGFSNDRNGDLGPLYPDMNALQGAGVVRAGRPGSDPPPDDQREAGSVVDARCDARSLPGLLHKYALSRIIRGYAGARRDRRCHGVRGW